MCIFDGTTPCHIRTLGPSDIHEVTPLVDMFLQIAREEKWQPGDALGAYCDGSAYVGLYLADTPVGGIQMVLPSSRGVWWPSRDIWPECEPVGRSDVGHVMIMGLRKEYRGHKELFWRMCAQLWRTCIERGITEVWLEATPSTLRVYRRIGFPLEVIGSCRLHWNEPCVLCRMTIEGVRSGHGKVVDVAVLPVARKHGAWYIRCYQGRKKIELLANYRGAIFRSILLGCKGAELDALGAS